jgi:hypothetical protein
VRYLLNVGESANLHTSPVGASLLAMDENDYAGCLDESVLLSSIASRLAPTGTSVYVLTITESTKIHLGKRSFSICNRTLSLRPNLLKRFR